MSAQSYRLAELDDLPRASRERLRATVEELERLKCLVDLLRIAAGPARIVAVELALEHRREQVKPEHDRAACPVCVAIDRVAPDVRGA